MVTKTECNTIYLSIVENEGKWCASIVCPESLQTTVVCLLNSITRITNECTTLTAQHSDNAVS